MIHGQLKLFSGSAHPALAKEIAEHLGIPLGAARLHRFPDSAGFGQKMQEAELDYLVHSEALSKSLAENYVGLPLNFGQP